MYYALNSNVYLVKGHSRGCIYDFNSSKLYSVNKALSDEIDLVNRGEVSHGSVTDELNEVFEKFIQMGILTLSERSVSHQIDEIKSPDTGCKFAWIEITNKCNLKCRHCYNESDAQCDNVMSLHHYKVVIDSLLSLGIRKVQLIGGEPFFDKQILKEMLDYAIGKFELIEIFTNGTLIDSAWLDYIAENDIHIALSVYSYKKDMHDRVTGQTGSWEKTTSTIDAMKRHGIAYRVCNVLMKGIDLGNKTTDIYELSNEKDIVRMSGRASFSLLSDDLIRKRLITKKTFQTPIRKSFVSRLVSGHNCFKDKLYISSNMEVFPCVMERRLKHCVISEDGGIALDNSIRSFNKDRINECCQCEYRYACFDCRPNSLSSDLWEKPWYCTYKPLLGEWEDEDEFIKNLKYKWGE